jgi:hypothetical protein
MWSTQMATKSSYSAVPSRKFLFAPSLACGINRYQKKSPPRANTHEGLHPAYLALHRLHPIPRRISGVPSSKAGLLASGSFYFPHLPVSMRSETVASADFVPGYSGGTAPDLNGIPY